MELDSKPRFCMVQILFHYSVLPSFPLTTETVLRDGVEVEVVVIF